MFFDPFIRNENLILVRKKQDQPFNKPAVWALQKLQRGIKQQTRRTWKSCQEAKLKISWITWKPNKNKLQKWWQVLSIFRNWRKKILKPNPSQQETGIVWKFSTQSRQNDGFQHMKPLEFYPSSLARSKCSLTLFTKIYFLVVDILECVNYQSNVVPQAFEVMFVHYIWYQIFKDRLCFIGKWKLFNSEVILFQGEIRLIKVDFCLMLVGVDASELLMDRSWERFVIKKKRGMHLGTFWI